MRPSHRGVRGRRGSQQRLTTIRMPNQGGTTSMRLASRSREPALNGCELRRKAGVLRPNNYAAARRGTGNKSVSCGMPRMAARVSSALRAPTCGRGCNR